MVSFKFIKNSLKEFIKIEAFSGILLGFSAIFAFIIANSPASTFYFSALEFKVFDLTLHYWIDNGLMAIFFFVVGLEIKKELVLGHLSSAKKSSLPVAAALGGMIFPALVYSFFNTAPPASQGWGIPMATDIAFAVGMLALFGSRVPLPLKVFLLALAIIDDLGAILVIAFFYTSEIKGVGLGIAFATLGIMTMFRYSGLRSYLIYSIFGTIVWTGFFYSGVHATIAGVLLGLLTPTKFPKERNSKEVYSPLEDLIHKLHPFSSFVVLPLFAFANSGIDLRSANIIEVVRNPISIGIVLGLLIGKPLGIFFASYSSVKLGFASLPQGINWFHILGVGFLAGIGFTMSLFISGLALPSELGVYSKTGIVIGSILSAVVGGLLLRVSLKRS